MNLLFGCVLGVGLVALAIHMPWYVTVVVAYLLLKDDL